MRTRIPIEEGAEEPRRARLGALRIQPKEKNYDYANRIPVVTGAGPGQATRAERDGPHSLEGLASSIRNDGLLQNLVVRPVKGKRPALLHRQRRTPLPRPEVLGAARRAGWQLRRAGRNPHQLVPRTAAWRVYSKLRNYVADTPNLI